MGGKKIIYKEYKKLGELLISKTVTGKQEGNGAVSLSLFKKMKANMEVYTQPNYQSSFQLCTVSNILPPKHPISERHWRKSSTKM